MIYFVQAEQGGLIKIGYGADYCFKYRMKQLQRGSPVPLVVLAVLDEIENDPQGEMELHVRFAEHRAYSEWFYPAPEILAVVEEARKTSGEWLDYRIKIRPPTGKNKTKPYRRGCRDTSFDTEET